MTAFTQIENAYNNSTLNNNLFEKAVKSLAVKSYKDGSSLCFLFADNSELSCDSLDPFNLNYATFVSGDLSLVADLKKIA